MCMCVCICVCPHVCVFIKSDLLIQFAACLLWVRMAFLFNTMSHSGCILKVFEEYSTLKTLI